MRHTKFTFFVLSHFFLSLSPAGVSESLSPLVTVQNIVEWTETEAIQSVPDLLKRLPEGYRTFSVLQHQSRSRHQASFQFPRVIFYGPDASLLTAVSTHPEDPNFQTVEFIQYEPQTRKFTAHELHFSDGKTKWTLNSPTCHRCHRKDLRPNWEPYNLWPGTYGSVQDKVSPGSREHEELTTLLSQFKTNERLAQLVGPLTMQSVGIQGTTHYTTTQGVGRGSVLSLLISVLNRERITRMINDAPNSFAYRYALTGALMTCEHIEDFLPESLRSDPLKTWGHWVNETKEYMVSHFEKEIQRTAKLAGFPSENRVRKNADPHGHRHAEVIRVTGLRMLLEPLGVPVWDWSMALRKKTYAFNDGVNGLENLLGHYLPTVFSAEEISQLDLDFESLTLDFTHYIKNGESRPYPITINQQLRVTQE